MYRAIPGWPNDKVLPDAYISGSNIYSAQEGVLMRWMEVCAESSNQQLPRLKTFDAGLKDGLYISSMLSYYVGQSVSKHLAGMRSHCETIQETKFNATKILNALNDMKFSIPIDLGNLAEPSGRENLILVLHLFNQIPNYMPKGTEVFSCVLGKDLTKTLTLSNKTNRPISYWVKLEKDEDFKLEGGDMIKLEPIQSVNYKIKFSSRISLPVSDRITFMPKRDNNNFTAAIVYDLKSDIKGRESVNVQQIDGKLYETKDFFIEVVHNFKMDFGTFNITCLYEKEKSDSRRKQLNSKQ